MNSPPTIRPHTSAEGPAPATKTPEVYLRDCLGKIVRRINRADADRMVTDGIANRVSAAGHVRLKPEVRSAVDFGVHGLPAVEAARHFHGDKKTAAAVAQIDSGHAGAGMQLARRRR